MKYINNGKKYRIIDYVYMPFHAAPIASGLKCLNMVANGLTTSIQALVTALFVDTALAIFAGEAARIDIYKPLVFILLLVVYGYTSSSINKFTNLRIEQKFAGPYLGELIEKRAKLEYSHIENNDTWDLISRVCKEADKKIINGFEHFLSMIELVIRVVSLLIVFTTQIWWAGLAIIGLSVPLFFVSAKAGKKEYTAFKLAEKQTRRADYLKSVITSREASEERSLFGYTDDVNRRWYERADNARRIELKVIAEQFVRMKGSSIITAILSLLIIAMLLIPYSRGELSSGMFISLVTGTLGLVQMMSWQLSYITNELAKDREYLKDLTEFNGLSETENALDLPAPADSVSFNTIEFINVSFRYPGTEKYVLRDFNLKLSSGVHYAVVGVNGAGKTTLTKLLTGLYDNFEGEILIDGKSIREYSQARLKALFSVVYQDFAKYYIKASDNITIGDVLTHDNERIAESTAYIGLNEAIAALPNGIETYLGKIHESGVDISGGQWQRFAIARALYNPALISILDEPTAALDPVAESEIYELFGRISLGKSAIFITHRLGAAKLADEIIVVDEGRVAEKGNHDSLVTLGGIYAGMFEAQRSWYI